MSRARTRERRQQREQEQRRQRQIAIAVGLAIVAVIAVVVIILVNQPAEATIPQEAFELYAGLPQSTTEEGFPVLGNTNAPVQVVEYSSFDCPHCRDFHETVTPALVERVRAGEIAFTYVPLFGTGGIANGQGAARAAICAGEQDAFWPFHSTLFNWQGTYANTAFAGNRLTTGVNNLGIDRAQWDQCFNGETADTVLNAANAAANTQEGFTGTPFVTVNGTSVTPDLGSINTAINQALAASPLPVEPIVDATEETATEDATEEAIEADATLEMTEEATTEAGS